MTLPQLPWVSVGLFVLAKGSEALGFVFETVLGCCVTNWLLYVIQASRSSHKPWLAISCDNYKISKPVLSTPLILPIPRKVAVISF